MGKGVFDVDCEEEIRFGVCVRGEEKERGNNYEET